MNLSDRLLTITNRHLPNCQIAKAFTKTSTVATVCQCREVMTRVGDQGQYLVGIIDNLMGYKHLFGNNNMLGHVVQH